MDVVLSALFLLFDIYYYALIVYILLSWLPGARDSSFGHFLARICDPYLEPFRRFIPSLGMIDISPIVAILVLRFAKIGLARLVEMIL
jgi:YggT family protein